MSDKVQETIAERGKIYGDPYLSHVNIGLAWTGLIQQHYGITLTHPLPASLVAAMLVDFKMSRGARHESPHHPDNFVDAHAYVGFGEEFQRREKSPVATSPVVPQSVLTAMELDQTPLVSWRTFYDLHPKPGENIKVLMPDGGFAEGGVTRFFNGAVTTFISFIARPDIEVPSSSAWRYV